jgi:hypothetical protein
VEQFGVPGQRADRELVAVLSEVGELRQAVDVHQELGPGEAELHHRDEAVPARERPGFPVSVGQQRERGLKRGRALVLDGRRYLHGAYPLSGSTRSHNVIMRLPIRMVHGGVPSSAFRPPTYVTIRS